MKRKLNFRTFFALACCTAAVCGLPGCAPAAPDRTVSCGEPSLRPGLSSAPQDRTVSCGESSLRPGPSSAPQDRTESARPSSAPEQTRGMTLEQKVGQMFFLAFRYSTDGTVLRTYDQTVHDTIRAIQPGGIVLFGENIRTTPQVRELIRRMKHDCSIPPFLSVDQEGGAVQRIRRTDLIPATDIPPMWDVGRTGNIELARRVGGVIGSELSVFGFNMDFAPDCDVFSNPNNKVIGKRSFSSDPRKAAEFSVAVSEGLRGTGIIPVCKHFPGHGDTETDTHAGYASVDKTLEELHQTELVPFEAQIRAGAEMIMVAHISLPKINGDETPASLSPKIIRDLLRKELGFRGVILTDSLGMGAVSQHYSSGESAVRAVKAGADMVLMPPDPGAAYRAVLSAVKRGEIPESRIDESAGRILALKKQYGLDSPKPLGSESLLGSEEHRRIISQIKS